MINNLPLMAVKITVFYIFLFFILWFTNNSGKEMLRFSKQRYTSINFSYLLIVTETTVLAHTYTKRSNSKLLFIFYHCCELENSCAAII